MSKDNFSVDELLAMKNKPTDEVLGTVGQRLSEEKKNELFRILGDKKALGELENENYTSEYKYVEKFGKEDWIFTLNKGDELTAEMQKIYMEFSNWLGSWEM